MTPRVVLIGTMGAGKTTVGQLLAWQWGTRFRDTDHDVEASTGRVIKDIFIEDGEKVFRDLERKAVATALRECEGVVALGGGAVLDPATQALLTGHQVVFLRTGLAAAAQRVGLGVSRPMLMGNVRGRIKQLIDERTPVYTSLARVIVDTDGKTAAEVAHEVRVTLDAGDDGSHD